jgi:hypothetical protein
MPAAGTYDFIVKDMKELASQFGCDCRRTCRTRHFSSGHSFSIARRIA